MFKRALTVCVNCTYYPDTRTLFRRANMLYSSCQYANGDEFAASVNVYYSHIWRDYGLFWAYTIFNFTVVFVCSWLYLGGAKKVRKVFSQTSRKGVKAQQERNGEKV